MTHFGCYVSLPENNFTVHVFWVLYITVLISFHYSHIRFFLCVPFIRIPSAFHSMILRGTLYRGILFTCPKYHNLFSSITVEAVNK
jgi:hypothetical protein